MESKELMMNIKELIERKKISINRILDCEKQDVMSFRTTSQDRELSAMRKRIAELVADVRTRKVKELRDELDVLQTADDALCSILLLIEANTTKYDNTVFNRIWNEANKPYASKRK